MADRGLSYDRSAVGIDYGLFDEFRVMFVRHDGHAGLGFTHGHCGASVRLLVPFAELTVADLMLAVEEHMKECRG